MPETRGSDPIPGHVRFNDTLPIERVVIAGDGRWRDEAANLFFGWVWQGKDGNHYGQRAKGLDQGNERGRV